MSLRPPPRRVSVIVPARDAETTLTAQLDALAAQDYAGDWELIVADCGSRDDTRRIAERRASVVDASGTSANGASRARNRGAAAASGDFLAFCDADDVVAPGWLSALAAGARDGDLVAGRLDTEMLNPPWLRAHHATPSWERRAPVPRFLPAASTANCGVWRDTFDALGGFAEDDDGAEDRDFAWRAQLAGHRLHRELGAVVAYRYRSRLRDAARQHYVWGRANARLFRDFRAAGMPRTRLRDALRAWAWAACALPALAGSPARRGRWVVCTAQRAGHLVGSLERRVVFL